MDELGGNQQFCLHQVHKKYSTAPDGLVLSFFSSV